MAGGIGSRFWPVSRTSKPKQFLDILGTGKTLLQLTFDRFKQIIPTENILIVTNEIYGDIVQEQLPEIDSQQVLLEPTRKNTAPCIAYANYKILKKNPRANIVVAPSDHLILKEDVFLSVINKGFEFVEENDAMLTLGIKPSRPETGYGYIQLNGDSKSIQMNEDIREVKTFTEKPDLKMAKVFYESGEFFWNAGIFLWSLDTIMRAFEKDLPEVSALFIEGSDLYNTAEETSFINNIYPKCKNISIDYGIMEKASNVHVLCADFGWSDLGTWGSLFENSKKDKDSNVHKGENIFQYDSKGCIVNVPDDKLVVLHGLKDYIVAESDNALLVCKLKDEQKIKHFVNDVKIKTGNKYI